MRTGYDYPLNDYPLNGTKENSTFVWMRVIADPDLIQKWLMVSVSELKENVAPEIE